MHYIHMIRTAVACVVLVLGGCGGSGGGSAGADPSPSPVIVTPNPATDGITISGIATKGILEYIGIGCFFTNTSEIPANMVPRIGDILVTTQTDSQGRYSCKAPKDTKTAAAFVIPKSISIMHDEATGVNIPVSAAFQMVGAIDLTNTSGSIATLHVTPLTNAAFQAANEDGVVSNIRINQANSGVSGIVGFDPHGTIPIQSSDIAKLVVASASEKKYSLLNAAISSNASTDTTGCGAKPSFGEGIACTVNSLANQFKLVKDTAGNVVVSLTDRGRQDLAEGAATVAATVSVFNDVSASVLNQAYSAGVSAGTYTKLAGSALVTTAERRDTEADYASKLRDKNDLVSYAALAYRYALLSEFVYQDDPVNGKLANATLNNITDKTGAYSLDVTPGLTVLDWQKYIVSDPDAALAGLQFSIFFNDKEIIFAYRGTESTVDVANDLLTLVCR